MNAAELLRHYERVADAPDAVTRLRQFVLSLAVKGKLAPRNSNEESASDLAARLAIERRRLVMARVIKQGEPSSQIAGSDLPFDAPSHWAWVRLRDIGRLSGGMTPSMNRPDYWGGDVVWLSPKDIKADEATDSELKITLKGLQETRLEAFPAGSLFIVARSGILKRTFPVTINRVAAAANQDMKVLVPFVPGIERYLQVMFRGMTDWLLGALVKTGTTVQSLKYAEFEIQPFPIPPLGEQHRIVAKVDELMALCDRLEAARAEREAARDRLAAASLARLNAPDPETFAADARFALDALPTLTARPDQIKQLRQTILNLAVRGKLSPAADWQARPIVLGNVASLQNGYAFKSEWFSTTGIRLLRNANVAHGSLNWTETVHLPEERALEYERFRLRGGDVVLSLDRPFIVTGTKVSAVTESDLPALLLQRVGRFVLSEELQPDYLLLWINSPHFSGQIDPGRSNGVPHISSKQVEAAEIFLPPSAEQRRLVAKVNEVMSLCDRLEASLAAGEARRCSLLEVLLHETLEPAEALEEAA